MKSIKIKIGVLVLFCVVLIAGVIGLTSIRSSQRVVSQYSGQLIQQQCDVEAETVNALLSRIEQSVATLHGYALTELSDIDRFRTDPEYVRAYSDKLSEIAINAATHTEGAMTVYIRFNPEFTEPTSGLFASRESADRAFEKLTPTDFSMYDPDDTSHVGWYYIPVKAGKPTWMSPYFNENLNVHMVSYVIPLTIDGVSVGIVGMDIDFGIFEKLIDETTIYQSGFASLTDESGAVIYAPSSAADTDTGWKQQWASLQNGMRLTLAAPISEINAEANALALRILLLSLLGIAMALSVSSFVIRGITKPLRELNEAAGKVAGGELEVAFSCRSRDEVGALAASFGRLVSRLKEYIEYIEEASAALGQLSQGNLTVTLRKDYAGEFSRIKTALLAIASTMNSDMAQIKAASEQIAAGSKHVLEGAQVVSTGTTEQMEAIDALTAAIRTLSEKIEKNADGASEVNTLSNQAGLSLQHNGVQMGEMVKSMNLISASGEKILHMTDMINDIALQTNILALNASIEAARAGEAGKGFSIVAEEVKNLAVKTTEAAQEISALITNTVNVIADGTKIADETERSVLESATGANEAARIMEQITADSNRQTRAVEEILSGMEKITSVVQQTSSTAQEEADSATQLSAQAQMMMELVEKFRLDETLQK